MFCKIKKILKLKTQNSKLKACNYKLKDQSGQSLIEVLLIMILVTVVISGSVGFLMESYSATQFISDQTTATYLAIEGIELVKNLIDANYINNQAWNEGLTDGYYEAYYLSSQLEPIGASCSNLGTACNFKFDPNLHVYNYSNGGDSPYSRRIIIENFLDGSGIKVISIVNWTSRRCPSGGCNTILQAYFYDWRQ